MIPYDNKIFQKASFFLLFSFLFILKSFGQLQEYEGYLLRSSNWPEHANLGDREIQGVTHDQENWFFTWTNNDPNIGFLSKIPLGTYLDTCVLGAITPCPQYPGQVIVNMDEYEQLQIPGYWHWGDPDYYQKHEDTVYIVVPMTAPVPSPPIVAIFRASDLSLAFIGNLTQQTSSYCDNTPAAQRSVGWCAIDPKTGILFTSEDYDYTDCLPKRCYGGPNSGMPCNDDDDCPNSQGCHPISDCDDQSGYFTYPRELLSYSIPWNSIPPTGFGGREDLQAVGSPQLLLGTSGEFIELYNMQGGEFTPSGELLYISCGSGCCVGIGDGQVYRSDGLYVFQKFDAGSWRVNKRSHNHYYDNNNPDYFDYYYILDCDGCWDCWGGSWTPEGLTFWDLDHGQDPTIDGQLHVLLFHCQVNNFTLSCSDNEVAFEHFGGRKYVNSTNGVNQTLPTSFNDDPLPGGPRLPFNTFQFAYDSYPFWDGSEIMLEPGFYPETGIYSANHNFLWYNVTSRVRINSHGGTAVIGQGNSITSPPPIAKIKVNDSLVCPYQTVQLIDASLNVPTSWSWTIYQPGATFVNGTTPHSQYPQVQFSNTGTYTVTLSVSNNNGSDSEIAFNIITVVQPENLPISEDFEDCDSSFFKWYVTSSVVNSWDLCSTLAMNPPGVHSPYLNFYNSNPNQLSSSVLRSPLFDLSNYFTARLFFKVAYRQKNQDSEDVLRIGINDFCSDNLAGIPYLKSGLDLATDLPITSEFFPEDTSDWRTDTVDLTSYGGMCINLLFEGYYGGGNNLFIDNVNLNGDFILAEFVASDTLTCSDESIQFTDLSYNEPDSWFWDFGDGESSNLQNPAHVFKKQGYQTVKLRITRGNAFHTIIKNDYIRLLDRPLVSVTVSDSFPSCPGIPVTFTAHPILGGNNPSFQWKVNNINLGDTSCLFTYIPLDNDAVGCILTSDYYCFDDKHNTNNSNGIEVSLIDIPEPPAHAEAQPATICFGEESELKCHSNPHGNSVIWYSGSCGGTMVDSGCNITVTPTESTNYYVRFEHPCGSTVCDSVTVAVIPIQASPDSIHTNHTVICEGTNATLTCFPPAPQGSIAKWYRVGCGVTLFDEGNSVTVHPNTTTTYYVRFENECGNSSCVSVIITVVPSIDNPQSVTVNPSTICAGTNSQLSCNPSAPNGHTATWYSGNCGGTFVDTGNSITVLPMTTTNYFVRYEGACISGCKNKKVTVNPLAEPPVNASANPSAICIGDNTTLSCSPSAPSDYTTKWYSDSCGLTFIGSGNNINVIPSESKIYYARYEGPCGFTSCVNVLVSVNPAPSPANAEANPPFICLGMNSILTCIPPAPSGYQAKWFKNACGSTNVGTGNTITVQPNSTTNYFVRFEGTCGNSSCVNTTVTLSGTAVPPVSATATPQSISPGESSILHYSGGSLPSGAIAKWYAEGCGTNSPVGIGNDLVVSPSSTTTYFIRFEGPCNNTNCVSVIVSVTN